MYRKKTKIIIVMLVAIVFMTIGYALLSTSLNINGSTAVTSNWQVEFSDIRTVEQKGGATNKVTPTVSKTTANFEVDLVQPGDEITYEIDITNYGDIEAEVKGATYTGSGSEAIYVRFEGIRKGTRIASCEGQSTCPKVTITLKVGYDPSVTSDPEEKTKDISITLDIGQYVSSNPTPDGELLPELQLSTLVETIMNSNTAKSDSEIDFSQNSDEGNTNGLYYTSTNTEGNQTTYYFRGAVENNYVKFANYYWRILRINEDGSVRLIYQGKDANATSDSAIISNVYFNENHNDNIDAGYMYGTSGSSSYAATHANTNDSTIKTVLDSWYLANLSNYSSYLADAGFCNDRSLYSGLGYGTGMTYYATYNRLVNSKVLQFSCPQTSDLFTVNNDKGNKALDYPIGLITADELVYAGAGDTENSNYFLYIGEDYFTMSPIDYYSGYRIVFMAASMTNGSVNAINLGSSSSGVRPVINLKANVEILRGTGTSANPYVIA